MSAYFTDADELYVLQRGNTALMVASCDGHTAIVEALLADARVQVDIKNKVSVH